MTTFVNLKTFLTEKEYKIILAADAEPAIHSKDDKGTIITRTSAGGAAVALEPVAKASKGIFISRGRTEEDKEVLDYTHKVTVTTPTGDYRIKRIFPSHDELYGYYLGFANQTLWPLCHVAFERPIFSREWYEEFKIVNQQFANAIKEEAQGKTLIWVNDYQLSLVPKYLGKLKDSVIAMFWHIPWPTWEIFRILPQKKEILESLLNCDFIAFHRNYQARNFLRCVERELQARIDLETGKVYVNNHITTVAHLPLGIDTDVIKNLLEPQEDETQLVITSKTSDIQTGKEVFIASLFQKKKVIIGVDRLDYTKGLLLRMQAIDRFFTQYPEYKEKVNYVGILAPSREEIPSYMRLKEQLLTIIKAVNTKHATENWQPINTVAGTFSRKEIMELFRKSAVCLITPLDDGMNLVSKEFVIAASMAQNPGMLVLSQFAGSAIDLTQAVIVNPYDIHEVANALKKALEMPKKERQDRNTAMAKILGERNIYQWAENFLRQAETAGRENRKVQL